MNNLQENKIKRSIKWSHNTIESCYKSVVLKGWFMPPRVKLGANGSWWSQKWLSVDNLMGAYDEVTFPAKVWRAYNQFVDARATQVSMNQASQT